MKTKLILFFSYLAMSALILAACSKTNLADFIRSSTNQSDNTQESYLTQINVDSLVATEYGAPIPYPANGSFQCSIRPIFKDSVLYISSGNSQDYIKRPDNNPGTGKYYSWPEGLVIDSISGSINVSKSQGGLRYHVGFVKEGTRDTCMQSLVIAGAYYRDQVHTISANDTLAYPYFNAQLLALGICDNSGDDDYQDADDDDGPGDLDGNGNSKCEFDAEDHSGKKGNANKKHVKVRTISGIVNLKKSLEEVAFGSQSPVNGQAVKVPVYYKLANQGNKALQKTEVLLVFYNSKSEIPAKLLALIDRRLIQASTYALISPDGKARPPLILITRF